MPNYWITLFSRKTYKEWRDAGSPPEACFSEDAGSRVARMAKGDFLLCYVSSPDSAFVGVQEVTGSMTKGGSVVWGEQFPLTLPVRNIAFLNAEEAIRYLDLEFLPTMAGRDEGRLVPSRGRVGRSGNAFPPDDGKRVLDAILKLAKVAKQIDAAGSEPVAPLPSLPIAVAAPAPPDVPIATVPVAVPPAVAVAVAQDQAEATEHHAAQALLVKLGRKLGRDVWVAKNDRAKLAALNGSAASDMMLDVLPKLSNNPRVQNLIELIDVLWLRNGDFEAAFEVECTTSVYSGLLRMSDLVTLQPNIAMRMYIVAPQARREKVRSELHRPTFAEALSTPLHTRCRYLSIENLKTLEGVPEAFWESFMVSVIDKMSETIDGPAKAVAGA
jgi:hypothetical protein